MRRKLIAVLMLALFLLSSCDSLPDLSDFELPDLPWSHDSDDGDDSSEERDRDKDRDRDDEDEKGGDASGPSQNPLADLWGQLRPGGGTSAPDATGGGNQPVNPYDIFAQLPESFYFSSGAGAWGTALSIYPDGTFAASYHDSDMGDIGDGYPGGTVYYSSCTGTLSSPVQINDYTWSTHVTDMVLDGTPGEEYIEDDILWVCSELYGLDDVDEILIYGPNAPVDELPEEFKNWVYWDLSSESGDTLNFYGLYNVNGQQGYSGRTY